MTGSGNRRERNIFFGTAIALAIVAGMIGALLGFATSAAINAVMSFGP